MASCGIDLGTTNSCIAIVEAGEPKVVRDKHGRVTVPSVVHQDKLGKLSVGSAAKARLGQVPPPVITVKRKMGTDEKVRLGDQERSGIEVSRMILDYLRQLGEEAAQSPLENAVVTVPAYFNFRQKQDTETAARQAGFKEVIVLQEPVAAALAYSVGAGDQPMIVLAYDLGGGTFDATVLERTPDNEINVLAFGGDPWLGGDDFDTLLAENLRQRLKARNYAVDWDLQNVEHYAKFQRLKEQAEDVKKRLSSGPEVAVNFPGVFCDEAGVLVDLDELVTRDGFYALIGDKLERSVSLTRETLDRSGVQVDRLDKLIMVGGSSYIPRIQERLQQCFGIRPELVDPETIVAVGAAIKAAAAFGTRVSGKGIGVNLDYQSRTAKPQAHISGRLSQPVSRWVARLLRGDFESTVDLEGDRFRFDCVPLAEGETNEFALTLEDEEGEERLYADLPIQHDATANIPVIPEALVAKPIKVRTVHGLESMLEAGTRLPTRVSRAFETQDQSGYIRIPIYEGSIPIAEVRLSDVPRDLPVGSEVVVDLTFNKDYTVHACAWVRNGVQEARAQFEIPPIRVLSAAQVQTRLKDIAGRWARATAIIGPTDKTTYQALQQLIENELAAPEPKMAKVAEDLGELESLLLPIELHASEQQLLQPPLKDVERRLTEAEKNAEEKAKAGSFDLQQFRTHTTELRVRARESWERRDVAGWRRVISLLTGLEGIAAPVFDLEQRLREMSDEEAQGLAVACAQLLLSEAQTKPAAQRVLGSVDLKKLLYAAVNEPRAAALTGLQLLSQLVQAGVTELPGGEDVRPLQGKAQKPSPELVLTGLLRSNKR